jgi:hypothetical protein
MNTVPLPEYGIGTVQMSDATSGVRCPWKERIGGGGDVAFPSETGMAATFNRDMVRKIGAAIARNCIAHEIDILLAPATNIHRNPLCGRNFEYFSEDPYLSGVMSTEYIKGVQSEGGGKAIADVLFGKSNPCGKLPMTFMNKLDPRLDRRGDGRKVVYREGMEVGYRYYDKHPEDVWFPFGHGLSYTTFEYSNIKVTPDKSNNPDETVTVTFDITNTGDVKGKEIAQIYVQQHDPSVVRPIKELKEFAKVELEPGETKSVSVTLNKRSFAYYNTCLHDWYAEPDTYHILVGASSTDIRLSADYVLDWDDGYTMLREKWDNDTQFIMA